MNQFIEVVTTTANLDQAKSIARALVEAGIAGCVQIDGPLTSVYRWNGALCEDTEYRCVIKSRAHLWDRIREAIHTAHPYETPEILMLPIQAGSPDYLRWLEEQCRDDQDANWDPTS
jgi:periplasmic divalent cation tolerance protein